MIFFKAMGAIAICSKTSFHVASQPVEHSSASPVGIAESLSFLCPESALPPGIFVPPSGSESGECASKTLVIFLHTISNTLGQLVEKINTEPIVDYEYLARSWLMIALYADTLVPAYVQSRVLYQKLYGALYLGRAADSTLLAMEIAVGAGVNRNAYTGRDLLIFIEQALEGICCNLHDVLECLSAALESSISLPGIGSAELYRAYANLLGPIEEEYWGLHGYLEAAATSQPSCLEGSSSLCADATIKRKRGLSINSSESAGTSSGCDQSGAIALDLFLDECSSRLEWGGHAMESKLKGQLFYIRRDIMFIGQRPVTQVAIQSYLLSTILKFATAFIDGRKIPDISFTIEEHAFKEAQEHLSEQESKIQLKELVSNLNLIDSMRVDVYKAHPLLEEYTFRVSNTILIRIFNGMHSFRVREVVALSRFGVAFTHKLQASKYFAPENRNNLGVRQFVLILRSILMYFTLPPDFWVYERNPSNCSMRLFVVLNSFIVAAELGWDSCEYKVLEACVPLILLGKWIPKRHLPTPRDYQVKEGIRLFLQSLICDNQTNDCKELSLKLDVATAWVRNASKVCANNVDTWIYLFLKHLDRNCLKNDDQEKGPGLEIIDVGLVFLKHQYGGKRAKTCKKGKEMLVTRVQAFLSYLERLLTFLKAEAEKPSMEALMRRDPDIPLTRKRKRGYNLSNPTI